MAGVPSYKKFKFQKPGKDEGSPGNFGLPSPGEVFGGKEKTKPVNRADALRSKPNKGVGSTAAAAPAPKKAKKSAPMTGWDAKVTKPGKWAYSRSREELGDFYLNATSGMFSEKSGGKKKR